jgi:hypothetical protein
MRSSRKRNTLGRNERTPPRLSENLVGVGCGRFHPARWLGSQQGRGVELLSNPRGSSIAGPRVRRQLSNPLVDPGMDAVASLLADRLSQRRAQLTPQASRLLQVAREVRAGEGLRAAADSQHSNSD